MADPAGETTVRAGVAVRDVTPASGSPMSGYAVRTAPSAGVHDPLTVRALVVARTALVTVDVVGLHEDTCAQVRAACRPWAEHVLVHATHTHGGPVSMPGRLGAGLVEAWLETVVDACRDAVAEASATQQDVTVLAGYGADPGVANNRRRPDGPTDPALPVLQLARADGSPLATLVSYACHPVVLSADNHLLTADYPGPARRALEQQIGGTVLFATACAGDQNTGHSAEVTAQGGADNRTFARCEQVGERIAAVAREAELHRGDSEVTSASVVVNLDLDVPSAAELQLEQERWAARAATGSRNTPLYENWHEWATRTDPAGPAHWPARVNVLRWGPAVIITLPGEPFCQAGLDLRSQVPEAAAVFVLGYTDGCPGYLPSATEYPFGGYEVCDAHRYYGMPGPFAQGSLERLVDEVVELLPAAGVGTGESQARLDAGAARRER